MEKKTFAKNHEAKPRNSDGLYGKRQKQRKRLTNTACWNIQGLNTKEEQVFKELHAYNIDIAALTETKKKGQGNKYSSDGNYVYFWSGVDKSKRAKAGVVIAVRKAMEKHVVDWCPINERMLTVDIKIKGRVMRIFSIYAPTDDSETNTKDKFFDELSDQLDKTKNNHEIILLGDLNGRVGKSTDSKIIGRHGEDVTNNNGERWIELCDQHSLKILNGFFQHKDINKYTWTQKTKRLKSIIDYVVVRQSTEIKTYDVKVWRGAECGSDHLLVKAQMEIQYNKHAPNSSEQRTEKPQYYNMDALKDESTSFLYKMRLAQKLEQEITGTAEEVYETLKNRLHEAAFEALGNKEMTTLKNFWWTGQLSNLIEEKKRLYLIWLTTNDIEDRKQYNRYRYTVKKEIKKAKDEAWNRKCAQINSMVGGSRSREAWKTINCLRHNKNEKLKISPIPMETWRDYYNNLLTEHRDEYKDTNINTEEIDKHNIKLVTIKEIKTALRKMKNNKAPGPGNLPIELIKHATTKVVEIICNIFNKCLAGDDIPNDWKISYINSIYKKGRRDDCKNYRGISITSSIGRLYGRVLKARIEEEIEDSEEQSGFRPGRSCVDNVFTLKQIAEKKLARGRELHVTFIDLRKAFDSVPLQRLWAAMQKEGVSKMYIEATKTLYRGNLAIIKDRNSTSTPFTPTKGLKQGCCLSPTLFKIYLNIALEHWKKKCSPMGIKVDRSDIYTILFADDQVVLAEDEQDMTYMINNLIDEYKKWGLEVNTDKTQYMVIGGKGEDIEVKGGVIKCVDQYEYLGVTISEDGKDEKDITKKVGRGKNMIKALHPILWNNNLTKKTKRNIFNTMIESAMTYGSEVWVMNNNTTQKLLSTEMSYWRRCCRLTLLDHVRNDDIRQRMSAESTIIDTINEKQLKWYGHLRRMEENRIPLKIWNWTPMERQKRGRPRKKWITNVEKQMNLRGLTPFDWCDKHRWRFGCEKRQ